MEQKSIVYKRNYWLLALEGAFFMAATGFYNSSTVLPVYIDSMSGSRQLVGLTLTLGSVFMYVFRLLIGPFVPHIKNHAKTAAVIMFSLRPLLLVPALFIFSGYAGASLPAVILAYCALWICDGLVVPVWSEVLANTIDEGRQGRLLGWQMLLGGSAGIGAGLVINVFLSSPLLNSQLAYGWIFLIGGVCSTLSCVMMALAKNAPQPRMDRKVDFIGYFRKLPGYPAREKDFTKMMLVQFLFLSASMSGPFIILFSGDELQMSQSVIAKLILVQSIGVPLGGWLWGWLCDRLGSHNGIRLTGINILLPVVLSLMTMVFKGVPPEFFIFPALFFVGTLGGTWTCYYVYTIQAVQPDSRPSCIVLSSIITLPTAFASYLAGYLSERYGYAALFTACVLLAVPGLILSFGLRTAGAAKGTGKRSTPDEGSMPYDVNSPGSNGT